MLAFLERSRGLTAFLFLALGLLVYGFSLRNGFVDWDDTYLVFGNPLIKEISIQNIAKAFSRYDPQLYIPLTFLSYMVDDALAGTAAWIYHLHNLLLHIANALLVALFLAHFTERRTALLLGLLFLLHPLNTEAVAWASARKDVLSTFFFLLTLLLWMEWQHSERRQLYYGSLLSFLCGLLAKVMVVTLPVLFVLLQWHGEKRWRRNSVLALLPFFLLSGTFGIVALFGKRDILVETLFSEKLLMAGRSTVFYLQKFLFPWPLSVIYPLEGSIAITQPGFFVPLILLVTCVALTFWSLRATRTIALGAAFFFLTLIPTFSNFHKGGIAYIASDRYAYIPMVGLLLCFASLLHTLLPVARKQMPTFVFVLLIPLGILSFAQAKTWKDTETLFRHTLQFYPEDIPARVNLAWYLQERGDLAAAERTIRSVLDDDPDHGTALSSLGSILAAQEKFTEAITSYDEAAKVAPMNPQPHYGKALIAFRQGNFAGAAAAFEEALLLQPEHVSAQYDYGLLLLQEGKTDEAALHFTKAVETDDAFGKGWLYLGIIESERKHYAEAANALTKATELLPNEEEAFLRLGIAQMRLKEYSAAKRSLQRLLRLHPNHIDGKRLLEALEN
jgi:tetratricopeptide (TPR) repeat protein